MSTEAQAAPETGPMTLDQFTAALDAEQAADNAPVEEEDEAPDQENAAAEGGDVEEEAVEATDEGDDEEQEAEAAPIPDPPQSWAKDDHEAWKELTPKAREVVLRREQQNIKAMADVHQKVSQATKTVQALASQTEHIAHLADDTFEKRWQEKSKGPIQWAQLARTMDPLEYQALRADYETEKAERDEAQALAAKQSELARRTFLAEQSQALAEIEPELVDAKDGKTRREKTFAHLAERGFPAEVLQDISALELSIAYDAFRWRESQKAAKAAAALPRKTAPASHAKPVKPAGSGEASPQRNLQALSHKLTNSGKLDDFVALMDAEEAAKAKKPARR